MIILLLGSGGNLGKAFVDLLEAKEDIKVIAWDKNDIDVTDEGILSKKIIELKPDIIINTVAYNDVDECEVNPEAEKIANDLNVDFVKFLGEIALDNNILLVHYSSDYVFKGDEKAGYNEEAKIDPINTYGETKAHGEQELLKLNGRGLKYYLIRTSKLFGSQGDSSLSKTIFFERIFSLAKRKEVIKAINNEQGSFTYTSDLASATYDLIESGSAFGIYHLVNSGQASWYTAAKYFLDKIGLAAEIIPVGRKEFPRAAKRPEYSLLLNTKRPELRSWQEALDEFISKEKFL